MKSLYLKLHAFQNEVGPIQKSEVNPFFRSKYADINVIIKDVKPLLEKNGLVVMQPLTHLEGKPALMTILADVESGESLTATVPLPENIDPQKMGSAITYFRRYALQSILFLEAEDDDGNSASQTQNSVPRSDLNAKKVQRDEEPPLPDFNAPTTPEEMAIMIGGGTVIRKGHVSDEPSPFPKFRDCPHENTQHSSYYKCYACFTKKQDERT